MPEPRTADVVIAGAGVIGASIALELQRRGAQVLLVDNRRALQQTSSAAAGMLAAEDPHNPAALHALARYSLALYPDYLTQLQNQCGLTVPLQTDHTLQWLPDGRCLRLPEHSLDPRQLVAALRAALAAACQLNAQPGSLTLLEDARGCQQPSAGWLVHASGAWLGSLTVHPLKGQMLRVRTPPTLDPTQVVRQGAAYIVPRNYGPQAGTTLIGATVEDAGFDLTTHPADLDALRRTAAALLPELASAPLVAAWAGLRPATTDGLPLLGSLPGRPRELFACGHLRNGILLAPATAHLIADLICGRQPGVDLTAMRPDRFAPLAGLPHAAADNRALPDDNPITPVR